MDQCSKACGRTINAKVTENILGVKVFMSVNLQMTRFMEREPRPGNLQETIMKVCGGLERRVE